MRKYEKCQLKLIDNSLQLQDRRNFKSFIKHCVDKDMGNRLSKLTLVGMQNGSTPQKGLGSIHHNYICI